MLNLSPNLKRFLDERKSEEELEAFKYQRISGNELRIGKKIYLLTSSECNNCDGQGKHLYGSMKGYAYSQEDMAEDPDFFEDMLEGKYDITCKFCDGNGYFMILADNEDNQSFIEEIEADAIAEAEYRAEIRAERRYLYGEYW
jgi:predicted methyltransferase